MALSKQQIKQIQKQYPQKSVETIAWELHLPAGHIYKALGLHQELSLYRIEKAAHYIIVFILVCAPFVFMRGISDYADLPQRVFIQTGVFCLMALCAIRVVVSRELIVSKNILLPLCLIFIFWGWTTVLWAQSKYEGFYSIIHWSACAFVFFTSIVLLRKDTVIPVFLYSLCCALAGTVLLGLSQEFLNVHFIPQSAPPAAVFANTNVAAEYVALILPVIMGVGWYRKKKVLLLYACLFVVLLSSVFLFFTNCRSAWVALFCSTLWAAVLIIKAQLNKKLLRNLVLAAVVLGVILVGISFTPGLLQKTVRLAGGSAVYRTIVWENSLAMLREKPMQGFGVGGFKIFYPGYTNKATVDMAFDKSKQIRRAHNDYIQIAVETGLPGALLFTGLLGWGLVVAWRLVGCREVFQFVPLVIGISSGMVAFMVTACFGFPFQRAVQPVVVFTYLAILCILYGQTRQPDRFYKFKVPRQMGIAFLVLICIAGVLLARFNVRNILSDGYFHEAMSMEKAGANKRALAAGLQASTYNPYRMDILTTVGRAYVTTGSLDKGTEALEKVVSVQPYNLNALFILGAAYANAGKNEQALETFRRVLRIKPHFTEAQRIIAAIKTHGGVRVNLT